MGLPPVSVVIVDDEIEFAEALAEYLEARGFTARPVFSGAALFAVLRDGVPDLIILDLALGRESGFDLADRLRRDRNLNPQPAILFLSGHSAPTDRVIGLELGCEGFVEKTAPLREILARVRSIASRLGRYSAKHTPIYLGQAAFDVSAQVLIDRNGSEIRLGQGEVSLLRAFLEHRGRVLSRDLLLSLAPASDEDPMSRSIDGRVARLRRKLETVGATGATIVTVRQLGYRMAEDSF